MSGEDNDIDDFDEADDSETIEPETIRLNARNGRPRRSWREVERMREQRELDRLSATDNWYDDLDHA